ncbi:MAG: sel1 repeat family protein [Bryobacterales bacterium]|nr:sel1 repeat family protein [Bryobacterales bacterium]
MEEGLAAYRAGNFQVALREFRAAAEQGDGTAQVSLGVMYLRGEGVPEDPALALHWLQLAAEQGLAPAQHSLALLYFEGRGVARNSAVAANYFESAALQGLADAQFNLAVLYSRGDGVRQDEVLARFWHAKAAQQGLGDAQFALSQMLAQGQGGPADPLEAAAWLRKAAATGNRRAIEMLSEQSPPPAHPAAAVPSQPLPTQARVPPPATPPPPPPASAVSAPKDVGPGQAQALFERPPSPLSAAHFRDLQGNAAAGDADAQLQLAWHYLHGVSAPRSPVRSYVWAERSARNGNATARLLAPRLQKRLTHRQRGAARSMLAP